MKSRMLVVSIAMIFSLILAIPSWGQSRSGDSDSGMGGNMMKYGKMHGSMKDGMKDGMKGQKMKGGMGGGCPMAMGGGGCPMTGGGRCPGAQQGEWMGSFHSWIKNFMIHLELFELSDQQVQELESSFGEHYKNAVRTKADMKLMQVDLIQALRQEPMELKQVRDLMDKIASKRVGLRMNFLELYSRIMQDLKPDQKKKVNEVLGSPFPMPWEQAVEFGKKGDNGSE